MTVDGLEVTIREQTLEVVVARGDANRFTTAMTGALADAVREAQANPAVRFVRIRAEGDAFCLGREPEGATPEELRAVSGRIVQLNELLRETPLVVVCEVEGDAAGFGVGLIAASDVAIASESAEFWFPELEAGFAPTVVLSWLVRLRPRKQAFELVATGRRMPAAEALDCGLVSDVVSVGGVGAATERWLERLATVDAAALHDVKTFMTRAGSLDERASAQAAADLLALGSLRSQRAD